MTTDRFDEKAQNIEGLCKYTNHENRVEIIAKALRDAHNAALEEAANTASFALAGGEPIGAIEKQTPLAAWSRGVQDHAECSETLIRNLKIKP